MITKNKIDRLLNSLGNFSKPRGSLSTLRNVAANQQSIEGMICDRTQPTLLQVLRSVVEMQIGSPDQSQQLSRSICASG